MGDGQNPSLDHSQTSTGPEKVPEEGGCKQSDSHGSRGDTGNIQDHSMEAWEAQRGCQNA